MSSNSLKPTNEEIANYLITWIYSLDGYGIIVVDDSEIDNAVHAWIERTNLKVLRDMFNPPLYNSIQEYADSDKE